MSSRSGFEKVCFQIKGDERIMQQKPWTTNANYFQRVLFSSISMMKIALHANLGGNIEVMGLLTGRCIEENGRGTFLVVDVFPLPVEGTETRVNAQSEANEYMIDYLETLKKSGRKENVVGWYHSHPGYGCWLSGIDVSTQMTNQKYQDPFVAVVVDPFDSIAMGKVSIGSFRTYPDDYIGKKEFHATQMIPVEKIEDFGVHAKQYYEIESKFCRTWIDNSVLGLLKGQYWASILNARTLSKSESILVKETEELSKRLKSNSRSLSSSDIKDESKRASTNLQDNTLESTFQTDLHLKCCQIAILSSNNIVTTMIKNSLFG